FLIKEGAEVRCIMTESATKFITPLTLETVSENQVAVKMFPEQQYIATRHIDLAEWADLFVVVPATANFLGKIASGISDDLLTTIICATNRPVMIAPAMNPQMWLNPITQKNYKFLKENRYLFVDPAEGKMACHHWGVGRVAEPEDIFKEIKKFFSSAKIKKKTKKLTSSKKILITAGPTREPIDPVRFISNHSSGKMGYALVEAAVEAGYEVTLISGPVNVTPPNSVNLISIETTKELNEQVLEQIKKHDCLIMAAAPADFRPEVFENKKIKRKNSLLKISLKPTDDILKAVSKIKKKNQIIVGFALETNNHLKNGHKKLIEKELDMIVVNKLSTSTGFNTDTNQATILFKDNKSIQTDLLSKENLAILILKEIAGLL
ncbi:MAG: bifunctional phosphopantothenoylcysteine decarboxylase/phosphopantothenate--cysteine ligase CoaBC, partial [candidate division Zixibacteria bacterium]|nr:bifunctional phosphopantothenoylcysteine decarboxylase/phosphopantothenate--cysteine ligase CoaBC [candidate division Zixibacteria bacterium]